MPKTRDYLSLSIKIILMISIINAIYNQLWHIMSTNIFLLILIFVPEITKKYELKIPRSFEWTLLIFVIFTLFLGKIGGIITPIIFGITVGFIGLMILAILYSSNQIKKNYLLIILFSFNFALAFGVVLELLKYYLKIILGYGITPDIYVYSMRNLTFVLIGALVSIIIGFAYMKGYGGWIRKIIGRIVIMNPKFLRRSDEEEVSELIKKGENNKLEFKSSLRINFHTKEIDRKIEYSVLKTISSFLNSKGGILLIGVSNKGGVLGIKEDNFENNDRFSLHLVNIIKEKIGKKYFGLIDLHFLNYKGKTIMKVTCKKSKKEIFLRPSPKEEEFYIRVGPSSAKIEGSELIDYIEKNFRNRD